jgi:hypothetical protein
MRLEEPEGTPLEPEVPQPAVLPQAAETVPSRRSHLVAMVTRALGVGDAAEAGAVVRARYWNPHLHRWVEEDYESLESLRHRYQDEEGWELLQEQWLDAERAVELIFRARRIDFTRPSREQILRDIGMTPDDVSQLLEDVDRRQERE